MKYLKKFNENNIFRNEYRQEMLSDIKDVFQDIIDEYEIEYLECDNRPENSGLYYTFLNEVGIKNEGVVLTLSWEDNVELYSNNPYRDSPYNKKFISLIKEVDKLLPILESMGYSCHCQKEYNKLYDYCVEMVIFVDLKN